jgi:hypothetical protein
LEIYHGLGDVMSIDGEMFGDVMMPGFLWILDS